MEVSVEPADRLEVRATGCGADLPADASHLAARVATEVAGHDRLRVERSIRTSPSPAAWARPRRWRWRPRPRPVRQTPSVTGSPSTATPRTRRLPRSAAWSRPPTWTVAPCTAAWPWIPDLRFVVVIPDRALPTAAARASLPRQVAHADAVFNLGRMGLLIAGLADRTGLVAEAGDDRLHQDARTALFPEAPALLAGLRSAGALTSCWSGAGPSLLAVCATDTAGVVAEAGDVLLEARGVAGEVRLLDADLGGVTVSGPAAK